MKKNIINLLIFTLFLFVIILPVATFAAGTCGTDGSSCKITNPLGDGISPEIIIGRVIYGILGLVGSIALVMYIYGGVTWMLAAGNPQRVTKGKDIIVWATIGLVVIFASYAAVAFIIKQLGNI